MTLTKTVFARLLPLVWMFFNNTIWRWINFFIESCKQSIKLLSHPFIHSSTHPTIHIYFFFFFNVGPPKEDIFLTTFYSLYFNQHGTYYRLQFRWGQLSISLWLWINHSHITHVCGTFPHIAGLFSFLFRKSTIYHVLKRDSIHRSRA